MSKQAADNKQTAYKVFDHTTYAHDGKFSAQGLTPDSHSMLINASYRDP